MRLVKLPEIVGVIFFGILLGPNGFGILERDTGVLLFGTVGILFIMFYSGLELNIKSFKKKTFRSIVFGLLTFVFPMTAGFICGYFILNLDLIAAILFGSVFASHTLLTYPVVDKMGVKDDEAVVVSVGGTLIANSIAMLILAVIASLKMNEGGNGNEWYYAPAIFMSFSALVMIFVPRIARWFFRTAQSDTYTQYIFVITMLFAVASVGKIIGIEPIIGAFLAGLALNVIIPANSILMNRIGFIANTLFIPFFLIYVGMLTDVEALFSGWSVVGITIMMFIISVPTKYLAAYLTKKIFGYSRVQKQLIFGLTNTQAAGTLAVIIVGYNLELFPRVFLDGAVLLMLITCIISAIYTEKSARFIASQSRSADKKDKTGEDEDEKFLLLLSNPATATKLVDLALMMKDPESENPIYPLTLVIDGGINTKEEIAQKQKLLEQAQKHASGTDQATHLITRVDVNVASGVSLASKEFSITHTILGWNPTHKGSTKIFGTVMEHILAVSDNAIINANAANEWNVVKRLVLILSPHSHFEPKFASTITPILRLAYALKTTVLLHSSKRQLDKVMEISGNQNLNVDFVFQERTSAETALKFAKHTLRSQDFSVVLCGRKSSISFHEDYEKIPNIINTRFPKSNFLLVYSPQETKQELRARNGFV